MCSPLGAARLCQLVLGCAVVAMVIHSGSYGVFCMVVWCLCFTVTTLIFFPDDTRLYGCLPVSWGNLTVAFAALATLIFGANSSEFTRYPATVYCVVVYALCFTLTTLVVLATVCERAGPSGLVPTQPALSPPTPAAPFSPFSGGGQRLGGPAAGGAGHLLSSSASSSVVSMATGGSPKAKKAKPSQNSNAKGQVNQRDEDMELREDFLEPVDREALVYHLDAGPQQRDNQELSDEFFEVTVDDIRKRFAQLKSERRSLEEIPLMTKALKESQLKEKLKRYPKVVLRVQFPDRHVLQGFFRPLETVAAVRKFVKNHLEDPQLNFYLFLTPPKTILDESSVTLFQANLFPGALVYFGSDAKTDCYLQREHLSTCVSAMQANESIANCMPSSPVPSSRTVDNEVGNPPLDPQGGRQVDPDPPSAHTQPPQHAAADPGKVPKWLKLPGKK